MLGAQTPTPALSLRGGPCEQGTYCEAGSESATPCPIGTYGPSALLPSLADCVNCEPGLHCSGTSLIAPSGSCLGGFFCTGRAESSNPVNETHGDECPVGHYCETGSSSASACDAGYYQPLTQRTSSSDCIICTPGKYCPIPGQEIVTGNCAAGSYCVSGATTDTPTDGVTGDICPVGSYCPEGSSIHIHCPTGTFTNHTGANECYACPAGFYCSERVDALPCPEGHYCPMNTGQYNTPITTLHVYPIYN